MIHDLHYPKHDSTVFAAALDFLKRNDVAGFIFGGDQFDNEEISHHTKGKPFYRERAAYKKNTLGFDKEILNPLETALKGKKKVWIVGNHDRFEHDMIEEQPQMEGFIERVDVLGLEKRGWEIVPLGHAYKLGKLNIIHGEILTGFGNQAGMYPSRKAVELYGASVLAGHTHNPQSFTKVSPVEHTQKHTGWIAPCACNTNPSYLRNRPTAWLVGLTIVEVLPSGQFNVYPCFVFEGQFAYGGQVYGKETRRGSSS